MEGTENEEMEFPSLFVQIPELPLVELKLFKMEKKETYQDTLTPLNEAFLAALCYIIMSWCVLFRKACSISRHHATKGQHSGRDGPPGGSSTPTPASQCQSPPGRACTSHALPQQPGMTLAVVLLSCVVTAGGCHIVWCEQNPPNLCPKAIDI